MKYGNRKVNKCIEPRLGYSHVYLVEEVIKLARPYKEENHDT